MAVTGGFHNEPDCRSTMTFLSDHVSVMPYSVIVWRRNTELTKPPVQVRLTLLGFLCGFS